MSFYKYDPKGNKIRNRVTLDCSGDDPITEQQHIKEVNINNIVKRHGMDVIAKTAQMMSPSMRFDDVTGNDFQEAMLKVTQANNEFLKMPSELRAKFDNNPALFLDYVQNPDNIESLYDMGLAERPSPIEPIKVDVVTPAPVAPTTESETPPA